MKSMSMDLESGLKMKTKVNYNLLYEQLNNLLQEAPCHGKGCIGYQRCEYGIDGCYGSLCAIEEVIEATIYHQVKGEVNEIHSRYCRRR